MTFHTELSRPTSPHGATTLRSAYPAAEPGTSFPREPLYDALHACPTRRLLGWRMPAAEQGAPRATTGAPDATPAERC